MQSVREALLSGEGGRIGRAELRQRVGEAMLRNLPLFIQAKNPSQEWVVIGGGPSINDVIPEIRRLKRRGAAVVTVNKSHDWALEHGIVPWAHVLLDPKEWVADYVKRPRHDINYFIASQCHARTFDSLKGYPVYMWHGGEDHTEKVLEQSDDPDFPIVRVVERQVAEPYEYLKEFWPRSEHAYTMIGGPTTVGLRTPILGQNTFPVPANKYHLIGFDSSRAAGKLHGYAKEEAQDAESGDLIVRCEGKRYFFSTNTHMARQAFDFDQLIERYPEYRATGRFIPGFSMTVHGSGLLPFMAARMGLHARPECNEDPSLVGGYTRVEDEPPVNAVTQVTPLNFAVADRKHDTFRSDLKDALSGFMSPDDFANLYIPKGPDDGKEASAQSQAAEKGQVEGLLNG